MNGQQLPPRRLWWLAAGFVLWCSALVMLYALHAIGCTFGWGAAALRVSLAFVFVAHVVVIAWLWRDLATRKPDHAHGRSGVFLHEVTTWTLIAALASTVIVFSPMLLLTTCL